MKGPHTTTARRITGTLTSSPWPRQIQLLSLADNLLGGSIPVLALNQSLKVGQAPK
jgi:hypothetical protein